MMQSAAAAFTANARVDESSSSGMFTNDSSARVSLRYDSDSDDEDYYVSPFESPEEETT